MPHYRWEGADTFHDYRNDREIDPGDVVDLDAHVADPHPGMVPVADEADAGEAPSDGEAEAPPTETSPIDPSEYSVDELRDALEDEDYDWTDAALRGLREAEADGEGRTTALEAIDKALE